jgi:type IX secretion system PorP/SprF family membrane protein
MSMNTYVQLQPHKGHWLLPVMLTLLSPSSLWAQDIHFSQFFEAPLLRNPALAGLYEGDIRVQAVYKNQWSSISPTTYRTISLNGEYKMPVKGSMDFITLGVQLLNDQAGTTGLTTTHILPAVNYHKSLSRERASYLSLGFMGGWVQKRIDYSKITTNNMYGGGRFEPTLPPGEQLPSVRLGHFDGNAGISFNTQLGPDNQCMLFVGAAYHHFNRPKNTFYRDASIGLHAKYTASWGFKYILDEYCTVTLQGDVFKQGNYREIIGGGLYSMKLDDFPDDPLYVLHLGLFTRWKDALVPVIKLDKRALSVIISYDINISQLKTASQSRGGFELGLSYKAFLDSYNTSRYKVICPIF